jgi:hypothetical protein
MFIGSYDGKTVTRYAIGKGPSKFVEVNLLRFQTVLLYPSLLMGITNSYNNNFKAFD